MEIEDTIQLHNAVKECVAVAVPDKEKGEAPMAFIVFKDNISIDQDYLGEIKELCKRSLKEKASPKYYHILNEMPYTSNNKQDFKKLEKLALELIS